MKGKSYKVIKNHKSFKEGDRRIMHPNVAKILAKQGLIDLKDCQEIDKEAIAKAAKKKKEERLDKERKMRQKKLSNPPKKKAAPKK